MKRYLAGFIVAFLFMAVVPGLGGILAMALLVALAP